MISFSSYNLQPLLFQKPKKKTGDLPLIKKKKKEAKKKFYVYALHLNILCAVSHNFQTASTSSGISCMIPLRTLKKRSSGFLVNNSCVFGVEFIEVVTAKANDTSETLFVQKINTFSERKVYTWDIDDFFGLKNPGYSPEFEIGGHKWF